VKHDMHSRKYAARIGNTLGLECKKSRIVGRVRMSVFEVGGSFVDGTCNFSVEHEQYIQFTCHLFEHFPISLLFFCILSLSLSLPITKLFSLSFLFFNQSHTLQHRGRFCPTGTSQCVRLSHVLEVSQQYKVVPGPSTSVFF
jgi:hypothetical protein